MKTKKKKLIIVVHDCGHAEIGVIRKWQQWELNPRNNRWKVVTKTDGKPESWRLCSECLRRERIASEIKAYMSEGIIRRKALFLAEAGYVVPVSDKGSPEGHFESEQMLPAIRCLANRNNTWWKTVEASNAELIRREIMRRYEK